MNAAAVHAAATRSFFMFPPFVLPGVRCPFRWPAYRRERDFYEVLTYRLRVLHGKGNAGFGSDTGGELKGAAQLVMDERSDDR
jgi:hypothetical protein